MEAIRELCLLPLLSPRSAVPVSARGRKLCRVTQLTVHDGQIPISIEDGWYLDDLSDEIKAGCSTGGWQVGYSATAKPPTGVDVYVDCDPGAQP